jgi:tRNA G18 (ribose-2'-O)-methylase SpoU
MSLIPIPVIFVNFAGKIFKLVQKLKMHELNRLTPGEFRQADKLPVVIVLDNVRSQHNIGSVFRTADAFRIAELHLCGITATPPNREIHKTALGSAESVAWRYFPSTLDSVRVLRKEGYTLIAIEQTDKSIALSQVSPTENSKFALIFGNEVYGVDDQVIAEVDLAVEIPQCGTKHSLNISVAAGIVMWDFFNKLQKPEKT